jgi:Acetyltransferases
MNAAITVTSARTEDVDADTRASIIQVCIAAHREQDFKHLFSYIPSGGLHFLAYREQALVGHAVVTTRWLQYNDQPILRTAYVDAVATLPEYQKHGIGSTLMRHLASGISDYEIACLETDRTSFYTRLGWQEWRGPLAGRKESELIPTPDQMGIMVLATPKTPPLDLDGSLTIEYDGRFW